MSNPVGRPLKFKSPEELEEKITAYFLECEEKDKPLTMSGLALALDIDRKTLLNYGKEEEFFRTVQRARNTVEAYLEQVLIKGGSVAGVIFNLKNNFGWKDKIEQKVTGNVTLGNILDSVDRNKQIEEQPIDVDYEAIMEEGLE